MKRRPWHRHPARNGFEWAHRTAISKEYHKRLDAAGPEGWRDSVSFYDTAARNVRHRIYARISS